MGHNIRLGEKISVDEKPGKGAIAKATRRLEGLSRQRQAESCEMS